MGIILDVTDLHIEFHDSDSPETAVEDFDLMLADGFLQLIVRTGDIQGVIIA